MEYLFVAEPEIGMKVVPVFNTTKPSYTILDLSWIPEGANESEIPERFSFG